ncbi:PAS domain-containing protein, partial [Methanohalophilus sp.]
MKWSRNGQMLFLNEYGRQLFGYTEEEILGKPVVGTIVPEIEESGRNLASLMDDIFIHPEKYTTNIHENRSKDGRKIWMSWTNLPTYDQEGKVVEMLSVGKDVTERILAQEELRKSEKRYKDLVENINEIIYVLDKNATITYISPNVESISGYKPEEVIGKNFVEFVHPDDIEERMEQFRKVFSGIDEPTEYRFLTKTGDTVWVRTNAKPIIKNGNIVGIQGLLIDITDVKKAQEQVVESEKRFQKMLNLIPDMVSIHDTDMNIVYSNWNGIGEVPEEKRILQTKCYRTYRGYNKICPDCLAKDVLISKESIRREVKLPEGKWIDIRILPILDKDNNVEFFVEWVRDITSIKQSEQSLAE